MNFTIQKLPLLSLFLSTHLGQGILFCFIKTNLENMQKRIWNVPEPEPDFMITEKKENGNVFLSSA
jgi:hypothetical protein